MCEHRDDFIIAIRSALLKRGARQRYSLFFLISLSIIILTLDQFSFKAMSTTRALLNDTVYRVSSLASSPFKFTGFLKDKSFAFINVYKENKILKEELIKLKNLEFNTEYLKTENNSLKTTLDLLDSNFDEYLSETYLAKAILDKDSPYLKSIILNKGGKSGLQKGMPVLKDDYLIGRVVEVNYFSSRVLLINDLNSKIPVVIEPTGAQAILEGKGDDFPHLNYLPEGFISEEENTIFTSGKDGFFLPGIPIGKIKSIDEDNITVKLFADTNQLTIVKTIKINTKNNSNF